MQSTKIENQSQKRTNHIRKLVMTALMAALSSVLMFFSFNVPLMPSFIKMDLSELPALIAAFAMGPLSGAAVCLVKNLVNLFFTTTGGVGELSNFLLGVFFVVPAGIIYQWKKTKKSAVMGMALGTIITAIVGCFINAFVLLPTYATAFGMPVEAIVGMGTAINASVTDLATFAILLVAPFNIVKGVLVSIVTFLLYKRISSLVKGAKY